MRGSLLQPRLQRRVPPAVVAAIVVGLALRSLAAFGGFHYDEGVYYSAAGLLAGGEMPYRDFIFLHPPGILLVIAPVAWVAELTVGHAAGFAAANVMTVVVGGVNIVVIGVLVGRLAGQRGAAASAWLYATFPAAVWAESQVIIEPYVILLCLAAALLWTTAATKAGSTTATTVRVGAVLGLAMAVKLWAAIVLLGLLAVGDHRRPIVSRLQLVVACGATSLMVLAGFALASSWAAVVSQIVGVQLRRPPDGFVDTGDRLTEMFGYGPVVGRLIPAFGSWILAAGVGAALLVVLWRATSRVRLWSLVSLGTVGALTTSPTFWPHYAAFLAMSLTVVAGVAYAWISERRRPGDRTTARLAAIGLVVVIVGSVAQSAPYVVDGLGSLRASSETADLTAFVTHDDCLYAINPSVGLTIGRLPTVEGTDGRILVDTYGDMLYRHVHEGGGAAATTAEAFRTAHPTARLRGAFEVCDYVAAPPASAGSIYVAGDEHVLYRCLEPIAAVFEDTLFSRRECTT